MSQGIWLRATAYAAVFTLVSAFAGPSPASQTSTSGAAFSIFNYLSTIIAALVTYVFTPRAGRGASTRLILDDLLAGGRTTIRAFVELGLWTFGVGYVVFALAEPVTLQQAVTAGLGSTGLFTAGQGALRRIGGGA